MDFITRSAKNQQTPLNNLKSHFDWSTSLYADFFNSVKSLYAITPTPYNECTQLVQKSLWFNWMKVTLRSRQTAYIHCTELVWPRTFIVRSWCNRVEWLYGVGLCLLYCTVLYCTVPCAYPPQPGQVESHKDIETRLPDCRWWTTAETRPFYMED